MKPLRILYVGVNYKYINPTHTLLPCALSLAGQLYFYGPGYLDNNILEKGLDAFIDSIGNIDLIVVNKELISAIKFEVLNTYYFQFCGSKFFFDQKVFNNIRDFLKLNKNKVVASLLDLDVYASHQSNLDSFLEHSSYFIGPGVDCFNFSNSDFEKEPYVIRKKKLNLTLGLYNDFVKQIKPNLINLIHFVSESEFFWKNLSLREYDAAVPGTLYHRRKIAYDNLVDASSSKIKFAKKLHEYPIKIMNKLGLKPYSNVYIKHFYNLAFKQRMEKSKVCITDGGLIDFTIRKFFEIPASGSLLACWPTTNFNQLGFKDCINSIVLDNESDVLEVTHAIAKEPERYQTIASEGQQMVMDKHSLLARSKQLKNSFERIRENRFKGTYWEEGEFIYV